MFPPKNLACKELSRDDIVVVAGQIFVFVYEKGTT